MIITQSNFIEPFVPGHSSPLTKSYINGIGCCQSVRLENIRGWYIYVPVKWLELLNITEEDFNLYTTFIKEYMREYNSTYTYLGKEQMNLAPYNRTDMKLNTNCHIFHIANSDPSSTYSWRIYISFMMLRNMYIYYGWPSAKVIIDLLKRECKLIPEQFLGIGINVGHTVLAYKNDPILKKSTDPIILELIKLGENIQYSEVYSNQIIRAGETLKSNWPKVLNDHLHENGRNTPGGIPEGLQSSRTMNILEKVAKVLQTDGTSNIEKLKKIIFG